MPRESPVRLLAFMFIFGFGFVSASEGQAEKIRTGTPSGSLNYLSIALIFIRERPEEAADVGMKRLQLRNITREMVFDGVKRFNRALPEGVPGLPSQEGIRNVLEYDVKLPMKMKEDISPGKLLDLRFVEEVKRDLESRR